MLSGLWLLLTITFDMETGFRLRYPVSGLLVSEKQKTASKDAVFCFSILQEFVRTAGFVGLALAVNDSSAGQVVR